MNCKDIPNKNLSEELLPGPLIGNYVIREQIGSGGIGTVYRATHRILDYEVAIKVHEYFPHDKAVGVAFLRAANYLSQLQHPNIVQLFDYGFHEKRAYIVMELVKGMTLAELILQNQSQESTTRAINFFLQLLSAVRYAHMCVYTSFTGVRERGIIHGDIKPQNIFISNRSHELKLKDFMIPDVQQYLGKDSPDFLKLMSEHSHPITKQELEYVAREMDKEVTLAFGTPDYMAPEQ